MLKRSLHMAHEIARLHVEKVGTDCNVAVNTQAIAQLIALELVKVAEDTEAAQAKELSDLREAMSKITVLAHSGLTGADVQRIARALVWIKKACADAGYTVASVNGKPTT